MYRFYFTPFRGYVEFVLSLDFVKQLAAQQTSPVVAFLQSTMHFGPGLRNAKCGNPGDVIKQLCMAICLCVLSTSTSTCVCRHSTLFYWPLVLVLGLVCCWKHWRCGRMHRHTRPFLYFISDDEWSTNMCSI